MTYSPSRRTLLKQIAAAGALAPLTMPRLVRAASPNGMVNHIAFGANGQAWSDISSFANKKNWHLVAAVDVDTDRLGNVKHRFPDAALHQDWREICDKYGDKFDCCNVTVPDHSHAPIAMTAMNHGKSVYCQKPLCHEIYEVRMLTEKAAANPHLVTQMGIQIHSHIYYRLGVATIQSGAIGKVKEVHSFSNKKWGDNSPRPDKGDPVPASLDWNIWIGVAPFAPFIDHQYYHPSNWRKRLDYGTGTFGDMGCHIYDPVFESLALTAPISVKSLGPKPGAHNWTIDDKIEYVFPGTKYTAGDTVNVTWYDGDARPPKHVQDLLEDKHTPGQGSIFIGTEGVMLMPHVDRPYLFPKAKYAQYKFTHDVHGSDLYGQFVDAVAGTGKTLAPFSYSGPLTESVLLGSVAVRFPNQKLMWDAPKLKFTNSAEATSHIRRDYRAGWKIPGLNA